MSILLSSHSSISAAWKEAFSYSRFKIQFSLTVITALSFTVIFHSFFPFIESRQGSQLKDPLLSLIPANDVSFFVFFFLYSGIFLGILSHLSHPRIILVAIQTYVLVTLTRIVTIYLLPLEPPLGYIPLKEPFVQLFTPGGRIISKDLFFSGHMSTILSLYFTTHKKWIRLYLALCCILVGVLLLTQHVHYTIDVVFAIPATFVIYYFSRRFLGGRSY